MSFLTRLLQPFRHYAKAVTGLKNSFLLFCFVAIHFISNSASLTIVNDRFYVTGSVAEASMVVLQSTNGIENSVTDTCLSKKGRFHFSGKINGTSKAIHLFSCYLLTVVDLTIE
ncbi:hypothetical protein [Niabella drilacis]|uniref:Uncharacterized protein n=1 Tax=Niabella drilacis (strain DSM 25811 / CCM 8410 / CCUG 62505 / LMG 26954 / E90) TaxID=1285928 RepID=A0A1G7B102_NIADE|nr:hypothetical protein [Niabella drilacis]SDE20610.1 hypothetical protein SAMN04487894_12633 [Niabella drilacis]